MNNLKKLLFGVVAVVLAFGLVFSLSAFTLEDKKIATLTYRYDGDDEAGLNVPGNWTNISQEEEPEGCEAGVEIPCLVQFDTTDYDDIADFLSENPTLQDMIDSDHIQSYKDEVVDPR